MKFSYRYSRQVVVNGFGVGGQEALAGGRVLIVGLGGLGNPAAQYLAAAGVGTIGLMDNDVVSPTNLNRQVLFRPDDTDISKVKLVQERLSRFNPEIEILAFHQGLGEESTPEILKQFDVVLDCLDNLPARLRLNQFCLSLRAPMIHGGVTGFYGQLTTIIPFGGPCLRCFSPGSTLACDCARVGVLGPVPGVIGVLQAMEAIKYLSGVGRGLVGRLLVFDGLNGTVDEVPIKRDPRCPACGGHEDQLIN
jgi:molybdopterin/thiamine biosynthesis adenylyltransferase